MTATLVLCNPKNPNNLGAVVRAAACWDALRVIYTGNRLGLEELDRIPRELRLPAYEHVECIRDDYPFNYFRSGETPVGVEILPGSQNITLFEHPQDAVYVFGPEDGSIPAGIRRLCYSFVTIPSRYCLNLAAAVNVILYDRYVKAHAV